MSLIRRSCCVFLLCLDGAALHVLDGVLDVILMVFLIVTLKVFDLIKKHLHGKNIRTRSVALVSFCADAIKHRFSPVAISSHDYREILRIRVG